MTKELPPMVKNPEDVTTLTRRLIQIPSYVHVTDPKTGLSLPKKNRVDEANVGNYIAGFLEDHTKLTVHRQEVVDGRFNVIAANSDTPKLVLLGHTDTVHPSEGSIYDQFAAEIHDRKIYGLGATDMKSGLASILSAAALYKDTPDVMLAFYIDEEYDFAGMRALIKNLPQNIQPDLILSGDGGDMAIGNGCRGLMEIHGTMRGKSAHASRPHLGINAINGVVDTMRALQEDLSGFSHESLGNCSVNLARLDGGKAGQEDGKAVIFEQINAVPDIAKFKVDIRTSAPEVRPEIVVEDIIKYTKEKGLLVEGIRIHHDLGAWITDKTDLERIEKVVKDVTGNPAEYSDPTIGGYIDMQMLWDHLKRPPAAMFGPGPNAIAHQPNEYVEIDNLLKSRDIFAKIIKSFRHK